MKHPACSRMRTFIQRYIPLAWRCRVSALRMRGRLDIGKKTYVHPTVQIIGRSRVRIGENSCIGERTWINVNNRLRSGVAVHIGKNCFVGRDNFFSSGSAISLGDYCLTTIGCRFICSSHVIDDPSVPYITTGTTSEDLIQVGSNCFFGAGCTVLGNVRIGHGSVVGTGAVVTKDIPSFSLAVGAPAKVIKRYSFSKKKWCDVEHLSPEDLAENPAEETYLAAMKFQYPQVPMPWIAAASDFGSF